MIEVAGVCKTYRSGRGKVTALEGISFKIEKGACFAVSGKSGSGKTTLLYCLGGLEKPDRGRVTCARVEVSALSRSAVSRFQRKHVGFVFQFGNLISYLTVRENLAFPLALNGNPAAARERRIHELLDRVGLPGIGEALPGELSGGETQRIAFARAMAHSPTVLLADEPTASLDSTTGRELIRLMHSLSSEQGCTLIVATHDPEVIAMATGQLQLQDGHKEIRA